MGKKILLADDSITIQKVIELTFSDEDFEVVTVGNGRLAIEKVLEVRPDVVLCDIIMPEKDGYEVCDFIKKHADLSHIPVLLLTGAFEPFDQERATRVGCDGFLAKPFEPQALIAKVRELLRHAEARQPVAAAPAAAAAPAPAPPAPVAAAPARPAPAEPSAAATVWAAPTPVVTPVWEPPPQTRPVWTAPPPPPPNAPVDEGPVHFIPEDPFSDETSGFAPTGDTVRVTSFNDAPFEAPAGIEAEPFPLEENPAGEGELLPMTSDEAESLAEPSWSEPAPAVEPVAPPPLARSATAGTTAERDLFLAEVFEEASAAMAAPAEAVADAMPEPEAAFRAEPEPEAAPPAAPAVDFTPFAVEAEVAPPLAELEPAEARAPVYEPPAYQPPVYRPPAVVAPPAGPFEPHVFEPEPEPEPAVRDAPIAAYEPEPHVFEPEPEPEPAAPTAFAAEPAPVAAPVPAPTAIDLDLEPEESFEHVAAPEPAVPPVHSEAAAVPVPMDMVSQIAQRVVAQISEKVIREIAWEVIPDMAEALIKSEIERLKAELLQS